MTSSVEKLAKAKARVALVEEELRVTKQRFEVEKNTKTAATTALHYSRTELEEQGREKSLAQQDYAKAKATIESLLKERERLERQLSEWRESSGSMTVDVEMLRTELDEANKARRKAENDANEKEGKLERLQASLVEARRQRKEAEEARLKREIGGFEVEQ